jgi:hypothetical protein
MTEKNPFGEFVRKAGSTEPKLTGKYLDQLSDEERDQVIRFGVHLKSTGMTDASVSSYRSYIAQAMVAAKAGTPFESLSSSVRSALKRFAAWLAA